MRVSLIAGGIAMLSIAGYATWSAFGPVHSVAIGQPIRHDDFVFTVQRVSRTGAPGAQVRYTVDVVVQNQARIVSYTWNDTITYVVDSNGKRYVPSSARTFRLDAGASRVASVDFLLPVAAPSPSLRFWDGIFMGDAFDGNAYGRTAVPLN